MKAQKKQLTTRHLEIREFVTEESEMLGKYITETAYSVTEEDFVDKDTGEVVSIKSKNILFTKGTKVDHGLLPEIKFHITTGELEGLHLSNQKRSGYEVDKGGLFLWFAKVEIDTKGRRFIFYSNNIDNAVAIIRDYVEQHHDGPFSIIECKEYVKSIVLEDVFEEREEDYAEGGKKFLQIDTTLEVEAIGVDTQTFIVHTYSVERAMLIINHYLTRLYEERKESKLIQEVPRFKVSIEKAAPIPISTFIQKDFSEAYCKD